MKIPDLPEASILYISVTIAPEHTCAELFRTTIDVGPDRDLGRILDSSGTWVRQYFRRVVVASTDDLQAVRCQLDDVRGVVCGGSFHSWTGCRDQLAPWQHRTLRLVRHLIWDRGLPYLGLCGGGQVGLLATGGCVKPNDESAGLGGVVVRTEDMELTDEGLRDPIFDGCPRLLPIQAIHSDYFSCLPAEARVLARTRDFSLRAVALGDHVRLFQTHPELSRRYAQRLLRALERDLVPTELRPRLRLATESLRTAPISNRRIVPNFLRFFCARSRTHVPHQPLLRDN